MRVKLERNCRLNKLQPIKLRWNGVDVITVAIGSIVINSAWNKYREGQSFRQAINCDCRRVPLISPGMHFASYALTPVNYFEDSRALATFLLECSLIYVPRKLKRDSVIQCCTDRRRGPCARTQKWTKLSPPPLFFTFSPCFSAPYKCCLQRMRV